MGMFRRRGARQTGLESLLRRGRPEAPPELVGRVSAMVEARAVRPRHRWSRAAFAGAVTVFMFGTFASFGGLSYAASSAKETADAVKGVLTASSALVRSDSAAANQYEEEAVEEEEEEFGIAGEEQPPAGEVEDVFAEELPFTGISLLATALIGSLLLSVGILLRRWEVRKTS